jgi:apolipoprotein N-acyltransferase
VFGQGGSLTTLYDKIHLVPFGEYLPLQRQLEAIGLEQLTRLRGGFATGVVPRPLLRVPGLPAAAPLICYEAIFPRQIVQGSERPALMLNLTNDGWFGNTTGPRQHLHQAPCARAEGCRSPCDDSHFCRRQVRAHSRPARSRRAGVIDVALPALLRRSMRNLAWVFLSWL